MISSLYLAYGLVFRLLLESRLALITYILSILSNLLSGIYDAILIFSITYLNGNSISSISSPGFSSILQKIYSIYSFGPGSGMPIFFAACTISALLNIFSFRITNYSTLRLVTLLDRKRFCAVIDSPAASRESKDFADTFIRRATSDSDVIMRQIIAPFINSTAHLATLCSLFVFFLAAKPEALLLLPLILISYALL